MIVINQKQYKKYLKWKAQQRASTLRRIEFQLGEAAERFFEEMLNDVRIVERLPSWFLGYKRYGRGTPEDHQGIDFVIHTDRGDIKINVKSSSLRADKFNLLQLHPGVIAFPVNILDPHQKVFGYFLKTIGPEYGARKHTQPSAA